MHDRRALELELGGFALAGAWFAADTQKSRKSHRQCCVRNCKVDKRQTKQLQQHRRTKGSTEVPKLPLLLNNLVSEPFDSCLWFSRGLRRKDGDDEFPQDFDLKRVRAI